MGSGLYQKFYCILLLPISGGILQLVLLHRRDPLEHCKVDVKYMLKNKFIYHTRGTYQENEIKLLIWSISTFSDISTRLYYSIILE